MDLYFNSYAIQFKDPFGTLEVHQLCTIRLLVSDAIGLHAVRLLLKSTDGILLSVPMVVESSSNSDVYYRAEFSLFRCGLYFYEFELQTADLTIFHRKDDGQCWQISCVPAPSIPPSAYGRIMYQIFPDRFYKSGNCDLTGKLTPFSIHSTWGEAPLHPESHAIFPPCTDFFGGNLQGITEKLPYLFELGIQILYLNPIFLAHSNHRYDTADYRIIDPMLGSETDFRILCDTAHQYGMQVILDGVFSHTGCNSRYFDKYDVFGGGACSGPHSPYYRWYEFQHFPNTYTS